METMLHTLASSSRSYAYIHIIHILLARVGVYTVYMHTLAGVDPCVVPSSFLSRSFLRPRILSNGSCLHNDDIIYYAY